MVADSVNRLLSALHIPSVSLGYGTIHIYQVQELEAAQAGYSVDHLGASLTEENEGGWKPNWLVIGYEEGMADPIFIDTAAEGFPVYTAAHGTGSWQPNLIVGGLRAFASIMSELAKLAEGRENPVRLEDHPITADERTNFLERIQNDNPEIDVSFWESWLAS